MPFLHGGGLFIKTSKHYSLGDFVLLNIILMEDPTVYSISGKIAWITPKGARANKPAGIGVQFTDDPNYVFCTKIETILGGLLNSSLATDTM